MQHGLENARKVKIKWNETDANYDTFYYHVPLIYGGWIATKEGASVHTPANRRRRIQYIAIC